jgi:DNA-binding protein HU-beta
MKLIRSDLIAHLAARSHIPVGDTEKILRNLQDIITEAISDDDVVYWQGFGRFSRVLAKDTLRRNPRTKELITIPAHYKVKFVTGETLKRAVL